MANDDVWHDELEEARGHGACVVDDWFEAVPCLSAPAGFHRMKPAPLTTVLLPHCRRPSREMCLAGGNFGVFPFILAHKYI